jgi:hypothetical protein
MTDRQRRRQNLHPDNWRYILLNTVKFLTSKKKENEAPIESQCKVKFSLGINGSPLRRYCKLHEEYIAALVNA